MKTATILSNHSLQNSKYFFEDYNYQLTSIKKIIENSEFNCMPISYENIVSQVFDISDQNEIEKANKMVLDAQLNSDTIILCVDRGFTEKMEHTVQLLIAKNPNVDIKVFSLYLNSSTKINHMFSSVNNEDNCTSLRKIELIRIFCDMIKKENLMNYNVANDMTGYRKKYALTNAISEKNLMRNFTTLLKHKIEKENLASTEEKKLINYLNSKYSFDRVISS